MAKLRRRSGIALVETAIILPFLMLLIIGLMEYGWMYTKAHGTRNAARRGARVAVRADSTNAKVLAAIASYMAEVGMADSGYQVTMSPANVSIPVGGVPLRVTVTVPYANIRLIPATFLPVPANLGASVAMAKEGY